MPYNNGVCIGLWRLRKLKNIVIEDPRKRRSRTPNKDVNFYELWLYKESHAWHSIKIFFPKLGDLLCKPTLLLMFFQNFVAISFIL